ncbi:FecR domain-containing protein [Phenylobacterium sp. LjRoot219]|uniref:FecR family protein n=1 Tax=Phenylobacterium sp. LjRoot219 TaxID=3342283 RepID=UPI003ED0CC7F
MAAARWAAVLATDEASVAERAACEAWCRAHPLLRLAFDRMRAFDLTIDRTDAIGRETVRSVLAARTRRRRQVDGVAMALLLSAGAGWLLAPSFAVRGLLADYKTAPGEQRTVVMADGSRLTIDTNAALDTHLDRQRRTVTLFRGQVMAGVGHDARPFVVETPEGTATAMGTVFTVRREAAATTITVLESRVRVRSGHRRLPGDHRRRASSTFRRDRSARRSPSWAATPA